MVLSVALLALSVSLGPAVQDSAVPAPQLRMQVDSAHHRVIVTAGPFRVPVSDPMMEHMSGMEMPSTPVQRSRRRHTACRRAGEDSVRTRTRSRCSRASTWAVPCGWR